MPYLDDSYQQKLIFNGNAENRGKDHVPVSLLTISKGRIYYQWLLAELYIDRPFIAYGIYNPHNRLAVIGEINLLPLFNMNIDGESLLQSCDFVGLMPISQYLIKINQFKINKDLKNGLDLFECWMQTKHIMFEEPTLLSNENAIQNVSPHLKNSNLPY